MARVRLQWKDRHESYSNENNAWTQVAVTIWHSGDAIVGLLRFLLEGHRPTAADGALTDSRHVYRRTDFYQRTNAQYLFNAGRHLAIISYINPLKLAPTTDSCKRRIRPTQFRTRKESYGHVGLQPTRHETPFHFRIFVRKKRKTKKQRKVNREKSKTKRSNERQARITPIYRNDKRQTSDKQWTFVNYSTQFDTRDRDAQGQSKIEWGQPLTMRTSENKDRTNE